MVKPQRVCKVRAKVRGCPQRIRFNDGYANEVDSFEIRAIRRGLSMPYSERFPGEEGTRAFDRRDVLRGMTALVAGTVTAGLSRQAQAGADTTRFFPGFRPFKVDGAGAEINGVIGGQGPPLLLLHGAPQTHVSWYLVAPRLAAEYTVVAADLRGYGD